MTTESQRLRTPTPRSREYQDLLIRHAPVLSIAAFFVIICLVFALGTNAFLSDTNLLNLLRQSAPILIVSWRSPSP